VACGERGAARVEIERINERDVELEPEAGTRTICASGNTRRTLGRAGIRSGGD